MWSADAQHFHQADLPAAGRLCQSFRVPIARLAAVQAVIEG